VYFIVYAAFVSIKLMIVTDRQTDRHRSIASIPALVRTSRLCIHTVGLYCMVSVAAALCTVGALCSTVHSVL